MLSIFLFLIGTLSASAFIPSLNGRRASATIVMQKKGMGFSYDPSNYKDSNDANYRRLTDQLAAVKAEDEKLSREKDELIRKENMAAMFLKKENSTFWDTPGDKIIGTSDSFFIAPEVLQVIEDLDNQLIGLKPVCYPPLPHVYATSNRPFHPHTL